MERFIQRKRMRWQRKWKDDSFLGIILFCLNGHASFEIIKYQKSITRRVIDGQARRKIP